MSAKMTTPFTVLIILTISSHFTSAFEKCTDRNLEFKGYTFTVDRISGEKIWSHCKFPNPFFDPEMCGLDDTRAHSYVCDPDRLIQDKVIQINKTLVSIKEKLPKVCRAPGTPRERYVVGLAVVGRIRIPDLSSSNTCINMCGQIQPELNVTLRQPSWSDLDVIMENFASHLRQSWQLGSCDNDIILVYCQEFQKIFISTGSDARDLMTMDTISHLQSILQDYVRRGELGEGLVFVTQELRSLFNGFSPAHILLAANVVFILLSGIGIVVFLQLSSHSVNTWGREKHWKLLESIAYVLSGLWVIETMFVGLIYLNTKTPYWALAICAFLSFGCFAIYIIQ